MPPRLCAGVVEGVFHSGGQAVCYYLSGGLWETLYELAVLFEEGKLTCHVLREVRVYYTSCR